MGSAFTKTKYKVTKNILVLGILITGLLSGVIGILAFFGQNMGTFVVGLSDNTHVAGIILSDEPTFEAAYPRLVVNPVKSADPVAYSDIKIDEVKNAHGDYTDPDGYKYIAYTFWIKNEGNTLTDVDVTINISTATKNVSSAIRILVIEDDLISTLYKKHDEHEKDPHDTSPDAVDFLSDTTVFLNTISDFRPEEIKKYSIVIWLEGWDPDCNDSIQSGKLRMSMTFSIVKSIIEEE